jgi:hypothetical protein
VLQPLTAVIIRFTSAISSSLTRCPIPG